MASVSTEGAYVQARISVDNVINPPRERRTLSDVRINSLILSPLMLNVFSLPFTEALVVLEPNIYNRISQFLQGCFEDRQEPDLHYPEIEQYRW